MSDAWYCRVMGDESGPHTLSQLKAMARANRLQPDNYVKQGGGDWIMAERVPGLFSRSDAGAPPTPPGPTQVIGGAGIGTSPGTTGPAPSAATRPSTAATQDVACPRCGGRVIFPSTICTDCGYSVAATERTAPYVPSRFAGETALTHRRGELTLGWRRVYRGLNILFIAGIVIAFGLLGLAASVLGATGAIASLSPMLAPLVFLLTGLAVWVWFNFLRDDEVLSTIFWVSLGYVCLSAGLLKLAPVVGALLVLGVIILAALAIGLALLGMVVGFCYCLAVPHEPRLLPLIIAAVASAITSWGLPLVTSLVVAVTFQDPSAAWKSTWLTSVVAGAAGIFNTASVLMFLCFLRGIPKHFHDEKSAEAVDGYISFYVICVALSVAVYLLAACTGDARDGFPVLVRMLGAFCFLLNVVNLVHFVGVVGAARDSIGHY